jgi:hypothetical protein
MAGILTNIWDIAVHFYVPLLAQLTSIPGFGMRSSGQHVKFEIERPMAQFSTLCDIENYFDALWKLP